MAGTVTKPTTVIGMMKMGNIAPRAGIKATRLAFWTSVLTITPPSWYHPTHAELSIQLLA